MKGNAYNWKLPDIETLHNLYWDGKMSAASIARQFGVTVGAVKNKLNRYAIPMRNMSDAQALIANYISLPPEGLAFIDGLLLGDGCIFPNRYFTSAQYKHSDKHPSYIIWLANELENMGFDVSFKHYNRASRLSTLNYRDLMVIRQRWYPEGQKRVPHDINIYPITLFNWYIGDGNYHPPASDGGGEQVSIAMEYDEQGKDLLRTKLHELGIPNTNHKTGIYIRSVGRKRFFSYMATAFMAIPDCYRYKFPERYYHGVE